PFDLLEEIATTLALDTAPLNWPLGTGRTFAGVYDLEKNVVRRMDVEEAAPRPVATVEPAAFAEYLPEADRVTAAEEIALAKAACRPFEAASFHEGHLTPPRTAGRPPWRVRSPR